MLICKIDLTNDKIVPSVIYTYDALIDTGCTKSIISNKVVKDLNLDISKSNKINIKNISNDIYGYSVKIPFLIDNHKYWANNNFIVLDINLNHDILIGLDIIRSGKLIVDGNSFSFEIKSLL